MSGQRPHTEKSLAEARSRERKYEELQKKTTKSSKSQLDFVFDASPPSRDDARHMVDERKKERSRAGSTQVKRKPKSNTATETPEGKKSSEQKSTPHARPTGSSTRKKEQEKKDAQKKRPATKKPPAKKPAAKKPATKKPAAKKPVTKGSGGKRKKRKRSASIQIPISVFLSVVLLLALIIGSLVAWQIVGFRPFGMVFERPVSEEPVTVVVEPGMSARTVSRLLEQAGVITDARTFERYLEINGNATKIQPGSYVFDTDLTHALVAEMLITSSVAQSVKKITIFAGSTIEEIDDQLVSLRLAPPGAFSDAVALITEERGLPFSEGWFLSGTYELDMEGSVSLALANTMQDELNEAVRPYFSALDDLPVTLSEAVIIASLIQRETNSVLQMADIAGVIYNRIEADMPLGIDASLRYGLGAWDRPLLQSETQSDHPYNTRRTKGFPPSGVGSPSIAAIDAALHPARHSWFYYIHESSGEIHFAQTYEEHTRNIQRYLY